MLLRLHRVLRNVLDRIAGAMMMTFPMSLFSPAAVDHENHTYTKGIRTYWTLDICDRWQNHGRGCIDG